jgi:2,4-dienoyl-CoA reductase-like NADH-dependent reductase (Old Yellow Enzyme family)
MRQVIQTNSSKIFIPGRIGSLELRNRIIRSGCFEGMSPHATPSDELTEHHRNVAAGGTAMTTVSYCSVSDDGVAFGHEIWMRKEILPQLKKLTDAVHKEGAAASIQLGHCGFFANKSAIGKTPIGPSRKLCLFRYSICREMTEEDIQRVKRTSAKRQRWLSKPDSMRWKFMQDMVIYSANSCPHGQTIARINTAALLKTV